MSMTISNGESAYIFDKLDSVIDSIKEHFPDLVNDPNSIQYQWVTDLESARDTLPVYDDSDARNLRDEDERRTSDYYNDGDL